MFGIKLSISRETKNTPGETPEKFEKGLRPKKAKEKKTEEAKEKEIFISDISPSASRPGREALRAGPSAQPPRATGIFSDESEDGEIKAPADNFSGESLPADSAVGSVSQSDAGWVWQLIAKGALYALIFLTPLFFLPWGVSVVATNKQFLAIVLVIIAFIAWLAKTIASGRLAWPKTLLNVAMWAVVLTWGLSALFSVSKIKSLGFSSLEPDTLLNMLIYILSFFLVGAVFGRNDKDVPALVPELVEGSKSLRLRSGNKISDVQKAIYVFLASLAVLAVFIGLKFLSINLLALSAGSGQAFDFAKNIDFNPIGTINALGLFLGFGLALVAGLLVSGGSVVGVAGESLRKGANLRSLFQIGLIVLSAVIAVELLLINFSGIWWAMAASMLFLVAYVFTRETQKVKQGKSDVIKTQKLVLPIVILAISVILILVKLPIANLIAFPAEVSPSNSATYEIAQDAWKAKGGSAEIGSGPATFGYDYGLYRSRVINQTVFWGVKFTQGSSFILTSLGTVGILGFLSLFLLIAAFVWQALKMFGKKGEGGQEEGKDLRISMIAAVLFALLAWFFYPANFSLMLFGFIGMGLLAAAVASSSLRAAEGGAARLPAPESAVDGGQAISNKNTKTMELLRRFTSRNDDSLREISLLTSPQRTLIVSLILIILMVGSVSVLYLSGQKYIASIYFSSGLKTFDKTADPDLALDKFIKAINLDSSADQYWRVASQAFLVKTNNILNSPKWQGAVAAALEDLRSQFQVNMSQAISFAQRAKDADAAESLNWSNLGYIYENILFFVSGAEKFMIDSYSQASSLEPKNPALVVDLGRAHIAAADRLANQINQMDSSKNPDKNQIDAWTSQRNGELDAAVKEFQKAIDLKGDYSPAHFLLVQVYNRQGDLKKAIVKSADYYNLNPKDAGAAFQLGFLYYKDNQIENAKAALEWAVSLNESYSNARYFLGLIYDASGNKQAAKEQFEKIAVLNPENAEVKKILENLNNNRAALETIVPPLPAPEARTKTPVPETGGTQQQRIQP